MAPAMPPPAERPSDPKLATGLTLTGVGAALLVGGIAAYVESEPELDCPDNQPFFSRCEEDQQLRAASLGLMLGGGGTAALGLLVAISGGVEKGHYPRRNNAMMSTGIVLTTLGAGGVLASAGVWLYAAVTPRSQAGFNPQGDDRGPFNGERGWSVGAAMFAVSGTLLATGAPLWAAGAKPPHGDHDPRSRAIGDATPDSKHVPRSPAMMAAGIGMAVAGAGVLVGAGVADQEITDKDDSQILWSGSVLGAAVLLGVGVPFAVHGGRKVAPVDAYALTAPELRVGPGGGSLHWQF
jgi:hypothetical protein